MHGQAFRDAQSKLEGLNSRCRPTFVLDIHPHLGADIDSVETFFRSRNYHAFALHDLDNRLEEVSRVPMDLVFRSAEM